MDFIAKGKTEKLVVSSLFSKHVTNKLKVVQLFFLQISEKLLMCLQFGQTNPGSVCQSFGGVGRNIAGKYLSDSD